jgi:hypothetical protein
MWACSFQLSLSTTSIINHLGSAVGPHNSSCWFYYFWKVLSKSLLPTFSSDVMRLGVGGSFFLLIPSTAYHRNALTMAFRRSFGCIRGSSYRRSLPIYAHLCQRDRKARSRTVARNYCAHSRRYHNQGLSRGGCDASNQKCIHPKIETSEHYLRDVGRWLYRCLVPAIL